MAEEIVQYSRQAPFIEKRAEQLLVSVFVDKVSGAHKIFSTKTEMALMIEIKQVQGYLME